jgi:beta-galactosidase
MDGEKLLKRYWNSPENASANRLPMLNIEHYETIALDGIWRFQLLESPTDDSRKRWSKIEVPGMWTAHEQDDVFFDQALFVDGKFPFENSFLELPAVNPTGIFERDFDLPRSWEERRIVINLGGFQSAASIQINGSDAGFAKDSRIYSEFDITEFIKHGKNTIRISVVKFSDATYIENRNQWLHAGLSRSVRIYATEHVYIESVSTRTTLKSNRKSGTLSIEAVISSTDRRDLNGYTFRSFISELPIRKANKMEKVLDGDRKINFEISLDSIDPWSAESPNLYNLNFELLDPQGQVIELSHQKIGFRSVRHSGRALTVNSKPVKLKGFYRTDSLSQNGELASRDEIRRELIELKELGYNAIWSVGHPNDLSILNFADEIGLYVIGEPNISSHVFAEEVGSDPRFAGTILDRVARAVMRDLHHPSVVMWSLQDLPEDLPNFAAAATYIENLDPSRPLMINGELSGNWHELI